VGVSKNKGTPKWMVVYNGKPYCLMDDLGGKPTIFGNTHFYVPINPTAKLQTEENHAPFAGQASMRRLISSHVNV